MANVATLTSKRGGNRGAVTRLIAKISDIIVDAAMDRDRKIYEFNKKLTDLHDKIKVVETLDTEIVDLLAAADVQAEMDSAGVINTTAYDARDAAEFTLKKLMDEKAAEAATAAAVAAATVAATNPNPPAPTITPTINVTTATDSSHLPKFNLSEFDGNILLWNAFWDVFEVEVHLKTKYSNATKFNFLNSRLSGDAKALLLGFVPSNDNYTFAVDLLKKCFGQPAKIIMAHMRALTSFPNPGTDRVSLRKYVDCLESHIRGLEALNKKPDSYGDLLVCILLDKLSAELRRNLARQSDAAEWDTLRKSLLKEIEILEDSENSLTHPFSVQKLNVSFSGATSSAKEFSNRKLLCPFCSGDHWPTDCDVAITVEARYEIAKFKKLCFNCLRKCHAIGAECPSSFRCHECHRPHHTSLHKAE
jgi:hypothetical protein